MTFIDELEEPVDGALIAVEWRPGWVSVFYRNEARAEGDQAWFGADGDVSTITPMTFQQATLGATRVWVLGQPHGIERRALWEPGRR